MPTPIASSTAYVSGITWFDVILREGATPKTLNTITEADWQEVGGFREGTYNFTGDEMTITSQKYENGQEITSTVQDGTYGFEGDLANLHPLICKYLLKCEDIDVTAASAGAYVEGRNVIGGGKSIGLVDGAFVRLRFEDSPEWDSLIYLNAKLASRITGAGTSTDLINIHINCTAAKSDDADTRGHIYALAGKTKTPSTPTPVPFVAEGTILGTGSQPIVGASIAVEIAGTTENAITNGSGEYSVTFDGTQRSANETVGITISGAAGYQDKTVTNANTDLSDEATTTYHIPAITLDVAPLEVSGSIVMPDGTTPAVGASVTVMVGASANAMGTTDSNGVYTIDIPDPDRDAGTMILVSSTYEEYTLAPVSKAVDTTSILTYNFGEETLVANPILVSGIIVEAADSITPIPNANITVTIGSGTGTGQTNAQGKYSVGVTEPARIAGTDIMVEAAATGFTANTFTKTGVDTTSITTYDAGTDELAV